MLLDAFPGAVAADFPMFGGVTVDLTGVTDEGWRRLARHLETDRGHDVTGAPAASRDGGTATTSGAPTPNPTGEEGDTP